MPRRVKFIPKFRESDGYWEINIPPNLSKTGKRARLFFKDKAKAIKAAHRLKERNAKFGVSLTNLDPVRLGEASEVFKLLDATQKPYSLISIIREHLGREKQRNVSVTITEAFDQYLESRGSLSDIHTKQIQTIKSKFESVEIPLSDIEQKDIQSVLSSLSSGTANRYIRVLRSVFSFAVRKGYAKENVASKLDFTKLKKHSIRIFTNKQIKGMLDLALETELEILPYFCLGAFAGLRAGSPELSKLLWSDCKFEESHIVIRPEISKTHRRRFIPISPNLLAWLNAYLERNPLVDPKAHKRILTLPYGTLRKARLRIFNQVSPGKSYIPAGLRHTYTSACINSGQSIDSTCLALGHIGSPTVLYNHYFLAMPKATALLYWKILPPV